MTVIAAMFASLARGINKLPTLKCFTIYTLRIVRVFGYLEHIGAIQHVLAVAMTMVSSLLSSVKVFFIVKSASTTGT